MSLSDIAIRRPVFTTMMALCIAVLGLVGYLRLGTDLYPQVSLPFVTVTTVYPGGSPQDLEDNVTRPIEDAVSGISGVSRVFSQSREDVSLVFIEFQMKIALAEAVQQVRDKVGLAQAELPLETKAPVIAQFDIGASPVLVFSVTPSPGPSGQAQDPLLLRELLDDRVRPRLEQLDGVAAVRVLGGAEPEISVELFRDRMTQLGVAPELVFQKIRAEHLDLPAGRYLSGSSEIGVRVLGQFRSVNELRDLVVATAPDGTQVRLGDIALVKSGAKEPRTMVRTNGVDAVGVEVVKQSGANSAQVARSARVLLPELEKQFGFSAHVLLDQSVLIDANAHEVWVAIFFGGTMAILIIFLFLLDARGTFISALALPTSVIGTLFAMYVLGFSLNQLTLLGLSLAIGLLIDDAVVVRESITRRLEHGASPIEAASKGTREIALAVLATTLTLCAVFVPVGFMQGVVGQFFKEFGLTITAAVLLSLFVAFTLDPMLSARMVKARVPGAERRTGMAGRLRRGFDALDGLYGRTLGWVLRHRKLTFGTGVALFAASLWVGSRLGNEFMSGEDRGYVVVNFEFPPGTSLAATAARSAVAEAETRQIPGVTTVHTTLGPQQEVRKASWLVRLVDKAQRTTTLSDFKDRIRRILSRLPEVTATVSDPPAIEGIGDYPPIMMQVVGPDFSKLREEAAYLAQVLRSTPGTADVHIKDNPGRPELEVRVNRDEAARLGVPAGVVGMQVRLAGQGEVAARLRQGRRDSDIRVRLAGEDRGSAEALERMWIYTPRGPVELTQVARLDTAAAPAVIEHEQRERQITVVSEIASGAALGDVVERLHARLDSRKLPPGYQYIWHGMQKEMREMTEVLGGALALALVFIYLVLASQFESFLHPFTIMLSLPLALVGAVLSLALTGHPLNIGSNIGVIMLMGLVTKNAILLVDGALQNLRAGSAPLEAMQAAGPRRLRPILMTSAAMVLGMLPTALGRGMGSEFRSPMAIAVIGGVLTSTLLTLWVVPVVFLWIERLRPTRTAATPR
jgi:hydrophobic/amphiphilic exporter-1 (mainly G- bacteria), HAE1 family